MEAAEEERMKKLEELAKANHELMEELVKLNLDMTRRLYALTTKVNSLLVHSEVIKKAQPAETSTRKPVDERLEKMEKRLNALVLACAPILKKKSILSKT